MRDMKRKKKSWMETETKKRKVNNLVGEKVKKIEKYQKVKRKS
jgi:hypothetical protein